MAAKETGMKIASLDNRHNNSIPPRAVSVANHTGVGLWCWNPTNGDFAADQELLKVLGISEDADYDDLSDLVHKDDRDRVIDVATMVMQNGSYDVIFKIVRPCDGKVRLCHSRGVAVSTTLVHGFTIDITDAMASWQVCD